MASCCQISKHGTVASGVDDADAGQPYIILKHSVFVEQKESGTASFVGGDITKHEFLCWIGLLQVSRNFLKVGVCRRQTRCFGRNRSPSCKTTI